MELDTGTLESLVARIDGLEGMQKSQAEDINRIAAKLEQLTEKINELSLHLDSERPAEEIKVTPEAVTWVDTIKHYAGVGKMAGQAIETLSDMIVALADSLHTIQASSPPRAKAKMGGGLKLLKALTAS
ncbi:MAG: hypothetical protein ACOYU7_01380 [Bacillota bacterium]